MPSYEKNTSKTKSLFSYNFASFLSSILSSFAYLPASVCTV